MVFPTPPEMTKIDPSGDVLFVVGKSDPKAQLLVSSKVLSLASPVFTAMFRHGFQEGNNLSAGSLHPIPLPDDSVEAVTLLFNALHFRSRELPRDQDLTTLAHLAIACDKYDCVAAIAPWSTLWLHRLDMPVSRELFVMMLYTSYSLDVPESFARASVALMKERAGQCDNVPTFPGFDIVPDHLSDDVQQARGELFSNLDMAIANTVMPLMASHAWCVRTRIGGYFTALSSLSLWPSTALRKLSVPEVLNKASHFTEPDNSTPCTNSRCLCRSSIQQLKQPLLNALGAAVNLAKGMCLDCVKTDGESARDGKKRRSVGHRRSQGGEIEKEIARRWGAEWVDDFASQSVRFNYRSQALLQELKELSLLVELEPACRAIRRCRDPADGASPTPYIVSEIRRAVESLSATKTGDDWDTPDHVGSPYGRSTAEGGGESEEDEIALASGREHVDLTASDGVETAQSGSVTGHTSRLGKRKTRQTRPSPSNGDTASHSGSEDELRILVPPVWVKRVRRDEPTPSQLLSPQQGIASLTLDTDAEELGQERVRSQDRGARSAAGPRLSSSPRAGGNRGNTMFPPIPYDLEDVGPTPTVSPARSAISSDHAAAPTRIVYHPPHRQGAATLHAILESFPDRSDRNLDLSLSKRDLQTLREGYKLNSNVINAMLEMTPSRTCHIIDPLLFKPSWTVEGSRSSRLPPLLKPECAVILVPIHHPVEDHWTLVSVYIEAGVWIHLDSLSSPARTQEVQDDLPAFLEWLAVRNQCLRDIEWEEDCKFRFNYQPVDQQVNDVDCGIYLIENANRIMQNRPLSDPINPASLRLCYARQLYEAKRHSDADQRLAQHSSTFSPSLHRTLDYMFEAIDLDKRQLFRSKSRLKSKLFFASCATNTHATSVTDQELVLGDARRRAATHSTGLHDTQVLLDQQTRLLSHDESKLLILAEQAPATNGDVNSEFARTRFETDARRTYCKELQNRISVMSRKASEAQTREGKARIAYLRGMKSLEAIKRDEKEVVEALEACEIYLRSNSRLKVAVESAWD
ncbi:MAG: hypothetical protein M1839_002203 [Geoglossum umbratile]|nr:MAG: hypothetical protein M1839_002203 [Geoglossum umbratile]